MPIPETTNLFYILMLLLRDEIFEARRFNQCSVTPLALAS